MKNKVLVFLILLLQFSVSAQVKIAWSVKIRPLGNVQNYAFLTHDQLHLDSQGNIIGGWIFSGPSFSNYVIGTNKFDVSGNLIWENFYTGSFAGATCYLNTICLDDSDNVYSMGVVNTSTSIESDVSIKYDPAGNTLWEIEDDSMDYSIGALFIKNTYSTLSKSGAHIKTYDSNGIFIDSVNIDSTYFDTVTMQGYGTRMEYFRADGENLYALGTWNIAFSNDLHYYIVKVDSSRTKRWVKLINPSSYYDMPVEMVADINKRLYLTGNANVTGAGGQGIHTFTCAIDSSGDTLWTRHFKPVINDDHYASDIAVDDNNHVYVATRFKDTITNRYNVALIQYHAITGNQNWIQTFDSSYWSGQKNAKIIIDSSGIVYMAYATMPGADPGISINKIDSMGNLMWHTSFDTLHGLTGFVYDGTGNFYTAGGKLTKFSTITSTNENLYADHPIKIYPNPSQTLCTISSPTLKNSVLTLYDITGRVVFQLPFNAKAEINTRTLTAGVYIVQVRDTQGRTGREKLVKE